MENKAVPRSMKEMIGKHSTAVVRLKNDPLKSGESTDSSGFITLERVDIKNSKIFMPALPWSGAPCELYGVKGLNTNAFLKDMHIKASSPLKETMLRILGIIPTIAFPLLRSRYIFIETPWFCVKIRFKGESTVTNPESLIQKVTINPVDKNFEVESEDINEHINSSFEFDAKELKAPIPKFSIKNKFMDGMEVSASLKFELETPELIKFTAESKVSEPTIKVYNGLNVTLSFGFEAEIAVRKNGRNNKNNPFEGIEVPALIPLGKPFYYANPSENISPEWNNLISIPGFKVKENNGLLYNDYSIHNLNSEKNDQNDLLYNKYSTHNSATSNNITWGQGSNALGENKPKKYIRTITVSKHPSNKIYPANGTAVKNVGMLMKVLPFIEDAAEGLGIAIVENPELVLLAF